MSNSNFKSVTQTRKEIVLDCVTQTRDTQSLTIEWKIQKFFDLPRGPIYRSETFSHFNSKCYFSISGGKKTSLIFLTLEKAPAGQLYTLGIKNADGSVFMSTNNPLLNISSIQSNKDTLTPNGSLTVFCCFNLSSVSIGGKIPSQATTFKSTIFKREDKTPLSFPVQRPRKPTAIDSCVCTNQFTCTTPTLHFGAANTVSKTSIPNSAFVFGLENTGSKTINAPSGFQYGTKNVGSQAINTISGFQYGSENVGSQAINTTSGFKFHIESTGSKINTTTSGLQFGTNEIGSKNTIPNSDLLFGIENSKSRLISTNSSPQFGTQNIRYKTTILNSGLQLGSENIISKTNLPNSGFQFDTENSESKTDNANSGLMFGPKYFESKKPSSISAFQFATKSNGFNSITTTPIPQYHTENIGSGTTTITSGLQFGTENTLFKTSTSNSGLKFDTENVGSKTTNVSPSFCFGAANTRSIAANTTLNLQFDSNNRVFKTTIPDFNFGISNSGPQTTTPSSDFNFNFSNTDSKTTTKNSVFQFDSENIATNIANSSDDGLKILTARKKYESLKDLNFTTIETSGDNKETTLEEKVQNLEEKLKDLERKLSASRKENEISHKIIEEFEMGVLKLSQDFKELYLSGCQSDVIIKVQNSQFKAHRSVLVARSSVFGAMLEADMTEKSSGSVNIEEFEPSVVEDFLKFLYCGKFDVISSINAVDLYMLADKYNVNELKGPCCDCMTREISEESIFEVIHLARLHGEKKLLKTATDYFLKNSYLILSTPKWLSFLREYPAVANELLLEMAKTEK